MLRQESLADVGKDQWGLNSPEKFGNFPITWLFAIV